MLPKENICLQCGLCCDGTLFNHASIYEEEVVDPAYLFEISKNSKGQRQFKLTCCYLKGTLCSIYDKRPYSICEKYQCNNLKNYISGDLNYDQAISIIKNLIELRDSILDMLSAHFPQIQGETIVRKLVMFEKYIESNEFAAEQRKQYGQLFLNIGKFNFMVGKYFVERFED